MTIPEPLKKDFHCYTDKHARGPYFEDVHWAWRQKQNYAKKENLSNRDDSETNNPVQNKDLLSNNPRIPNNLRESE